MPDGSTVWLNAGSKLNYDKSFGTKLREVTLTGEAFFDVVKNPDQPFVIHTHRIDVKVLGTQFNVKSYPGEKTTEAALVKVLKCACITTSQGKIILKPNTEDNCGRRQRKATSCTPGARQKEEPIVSSSTTDHRSERWHSGRNCLVENKLAFVEEPFADVAMKLERWYGVSISFSNQKWMRIPLTGTFTK